MPTDRAIVAVYPGVFDPVTHGHVESDAGVALRHLDADGVGVVDDLLHDVFTHCLCGFPISPTLSFSTMAHLHCS